MFFIELMENKAEILDKKSDENQKINALIITTRTYNDNRKKRNFHFLFCYVFNNCKKL